MVFVRREQRRSVKADGRMGGIGRWPEGRGALEEAHGRELGGGPCACRLRSDRRTREQGNWSWRSGIVEQARSRRRRCAPDGQGALRFGRATCLGKCGLARAAGLRSRRLGGWHLPLNGWRPGVVEFSALAGDGLTGADVQAGRRTHLRCGLRASDVAQAQALFQSFQQLPHAPAAPPGLVIIDGPICRRQAWPSSGNPAENHARSAGRSGGCRFLAPTLGAIASFWIADLFGNLRLAPSATTRDVIR